MSYKRSYLGSILCNPLILNILFDTSPKWKSPTADGNQACVYPSISIVAGSGKLSATEGQGSGNRDQEGWSGGTGFMSADGLG